MAGRPRLQSLGQIAHFFRDTEGNQLALMSEVPAGSPGEVGGETGGSPGGDRADAGLT